MFSFPVCHWSSAAVATTYVNSVQYFSITIASGSTSNTATISSVGSGAFIIFGGVTTSSSLSAAQALARVTLTNSTTVTATRNSGTSNSVTVYGCVVDGTSSLITSVQFGTVTIAGSSTSGTASISAVTNANTALHYLGQSGANTNANENVQFTRIGLSGTTVTATRNSSDSSSIVVGFVAIEFNGSALNTSVQNVAASSSSSVTSYTATLGTSVNTNNTLCFYGGQTVNVTINSAQGCQRGSLTNGTTFTININTANAIAKNYNATVVEFVSGVLASNMQRGTTTISAATSNTSTISSVNTNKAALSFLEATTTSVTGGWNVIKTGVTLTNSTTVTSNLNSSGTVTSSWEVAEFT